MILDKDKCSSEWVSARTKQLVNKGAIVCPCSSIKDLVNANPFTVVDDETVYMGAINKKSLTGTDPSFPHMHQDDQNGPACESAMHKMFDMCIAEAKSMSESKARATTAPSVWNTGKIRLGMPHQSFIDQVKSTRAILNMKILKQEANAMTYQLSVDSLYGCPCKTIYNFSDRLHPGVLELSGIENQFNNDVALEKVKMGLIKTYGKSKPYGAELPGVPMWEHKFSNGFGMIIIAEKKSGTDPTRVSFIMGKD